jgi:hypothetical protein
MSLDITKPMKVSQKVVREAKEVKEVNTTPIAPKEVRKPLPINSKIISETPKVPVINSDDNGDVAVSCRDNKPQHKEIPLSVENHSETASNEVQRDVRTVSVSLSAEFYEVIKRQSDILGLSVNSLMRIAVFEYSTMFQDKIGKLGIRTK